MEKWGGNVYLSSNLNPMTINSFKRAIAFLAVFVSMTAYSQQVDYSVVTVPEESGMDFTMITSRNDYVCMPMVSRTRSGLNWYTNKIIDVSADGSKIAFLAMRGDATNVFVKDLFKQGASVQRTNRKAVADFSYSPDGKWITFSETVLKNNVIFQTDANNGFICRQITNGYSDFSPIYSIDGKKIFFSRAETASTSIWSYDLKDNFLSSYMSGFNPCVTKDDNTLLCVRVNGFGKGEIWKVNYMTGVEECIVSHTDKSFSTPSLSPDGKWILFVGSSPVPAGKTVYWNTDIYVCRTDGSQLTQLTYHVAEDLSPEWSKDGKYIYFISQRGNAEGAANIWRMTFVTL